MAIFCSILDPQCRWHHIWAIKTSSQRSGSLAVNGVAIYQSRPCCGCHRRPPRPVEGSLLDQASATLYQPRFPLYHARAACWRYPAGTKWRTEELTLPSLSRLISSNRESFIRAFKRWNSLRKVSPFREPSQDETGLHLLLIISL